MGPKKGVISQSVKDVVQSLVDDDLASKDKIGTSVSMLFLIHTSKCEVSRYLMVLVILKFQVYFWSLPSCAGNQVKFLMCSTSLPGFHKLGFIIGSLT